MKAIYSCGCSVSVEPGAVVPSVCVQCRAKGGFSHTVMEAEPVAPIPDKSSPEWKDWKISPGSWPYWMLERMHRETGRMSYDNPVKGMIRDLWSQVSRSDRSAAPEWDGEGLPPVGQKCRAYSGLRRGSRWVEGRVIWHREDNDLDAVFMSDDDPKNIFWASEFKPVATSEQQDTEELAIALLDDLDALGVSLTGKTATALAIGVKNRGWRKAGKQ
ncbi:hypothetical protein [Marinobacter salarius]|uniref:hypothetical protein n=1 Tax=Marinobacter salarius TaxID=1420917 RepID=UPI003D0A73DC